MSDEQTQPGVRIDASLWEQFRGDVEARKGAVRGHLKHEVEAALREYINASEGGDTHDRLNRMEKHLRDIEDTLSEMQSKEKDSDVGSTVKQRADEIEEFIRDQTGKSAVVGEDIVEMAIEQIAGYSEPTKEQYKDLLRERESLFPHPKQSDKFVRDKSEWVLMTQKLRQNSAISREQYESLVRQIGVEEFKEIYHDRKEGSPERGVQ